MSDQAASYRRILKSTSIIGGSSAINILIGLLRTKVLAVLLGPAGVGLISLYTSLMATASSFATLGVGTAGTRQIAEAYASADDHAIATARRALFWCSLLLASMGTLIVWLLREPLAIHILGDIRHAEIVGWLSLGVGLSVAAASQGALIQGMCRISDIARINVYSSILNLILGIGLLWQWGDQALWAFVLLGPLFGFLLGHLYVSRLPKLPAQTLAVGEMLEQWRCLLKLGIPFMGAGIAQTLVQLWMRVSIGEQLGVDAVGHFQAASTISMQYIGFVLGAMVADYYPRLTGVINDPSAARQLVNDQTEIALLLSAPIFLAMLGVTEWVIYLLYSTDFAPAITVLRWQILADVLKVASWPLGFVIVAAGAGSTYFWSETSTLLLMGASVVWLIPYFGLESSGMAFLIAYVYYLPLVYILARLRIKFAWSKINTQLISAIFLHALLIFLLSREDALYAAITALIASAVFGFYMLTKFASLIDTGGAIGRLSKLARKLLNVPATIPENDKI